MNYETEPEKTDVGSDGLTPEQRLRHYQWGRHLSAVEDEIAAAIKLALAPTGNYQHEIIVCLERAIHKLWNKSE